MNAHHTIMLSEEHNPEIRMAGASVFLGDDRILGEVEYTLRDQAHRLAVEVHQITLDGDQ